MARTGSTWHLWTDVKVDGCWTKRLKTDEELMREFGTTKPDAPAKGAKLYSPAEEAAYTQLSPLEQIQYLGEQTLLRIKGRLAAKGVSGSELKALRSTLKEMEQDELASLTPDIPPMDPTYERTRFLIDLATDGDYITAAGGPIPDDILAVMRRYPAK
jgi:hypothetical protein|tara:strand:- start:242 stop:715 length:474 start_codon:yes stop_codon:yes gene_type:complete